MTLSHELARTRGSIVISGASTGMGAATARLLAQRGYHVLAGVRREADAETIRSTNLEPVLLDITDPGDVRALATRFDQDGSTRLVGLINNAGIAVNAPVETLSLAQWRNQFEVNLFGHIAVTQALLPHLHRSRGRIVNISSVGGKVAMPTYGAYAGAKFALEAVSDALRRELSPHGVQVVVVEPGGVQTEMTGHGIERAKGFITEMSPSHRSQYGPLMQAIINQATAFTRSGVSADKAAVVIARAATTRRPRARYTIGRDAALMTRLARMLPDRTMDRLAAANLRPHYPNTSRA
jgi:NAD(P)-dependent dehydrogenase (short-subunit alcohol dehydrogenase family)